MFVFFSPLDHDLGDPHAHIFEFEVSSVGRVRIFLPCVIIEINTLVISQVLSRASFVLWSGVGMSALVIIGIIVIVLSRMVMRGMEWCNTPVCRCLLICCLLPFYPLIILSCYN